jgi:hypothetical protein
MFSLLTHFLSTKPKPTLGAYIPDFELVKTLAADLAAAGAGEWKPMAGFNLRRHFQDDRFVDLFVSVDNIAIICSRQLPVTTGNAICLVERTAAFTDKRVPGKPILEQILDLLQTAHAECQAAALAFMPRPAAPTP